jgi:hypothetical protein
VITARRRWYRGVHFRSTLEADWAATLDSLNITWQYEPEAYQTPLGAYSPDFWLPAQKVWLEVKGPHSERVDKAEAFANLLAVAHEQYTPIDTRLDKHGPLPVVSRDHAVLVYGLPSVEGFARIHPSPYFSTSAGFFRCWQCQHWTIKFDDRFGFECRVCGLLTDHHPSELPCDHVLFRHARDDDSPRAG